jgi:hypothetical protein
VVIKIYQEVNSLQRIPAEGLAWLREKPQMVNFIKNSDKLFKRFPYWMLGYGY